MITPGTRVHDRYRVVRQIGKGGMGAVYEAIDERLQATVALKQTLVNDPELLKAFEREARLLASLRHPALTAVSDYFAYEGGHFLVMQFIEGKDLAQMLEQRGSPFPLEDVLDWADQLLKALTYLHGRQPPIIHRDIKPQNMKLTSTGDIILLDFGLAKGSQPSQTQPLAGASVYGYTPQYAPLEQIQASGTTERSDLYSLAATLYHLLTNVKPADTLQRAGASMSKQADPLQPPHMHNPAIPEPISDLLMRALTMDPNERPTSASAMRDELQAMRQSATPATATPASSAPTSSESYTFETLVQQPDSHAAPNSAPASGSTPQPQSFGGPDPDSTSSTSSTPAPRRSCLESVGWMAIGAGIFMVLCIGIIMVLAFIGRNADDPDRPPPTPVGGNPSGPPPTAPPPPPDFEEYSDFEMIQNDGASLEVVVPVEWNQRDSSPWQIDGQPVGPALTASTDLASFEEDWQTPGMFMGVSRTLARRGNPEDLLERIDYSDACLFDERDDYEDDIYIGLYDVWEDCGGTDTVVFVLAFEPEDREGSLLGLLIVVLVSDADEDALDEIRDSFRTIGRIE